MHTLNSGIDVAPWINVASGKFEKNNKCSPLKCANLCRKISIFFKSLIRPQPLENIPKFDKRRGMFIPDSRVGDRRQMMPHVYLSKTLYQQKVKHCISRIPKYGKFSQ